MRRSAGQFVSADGGIRLRLFQYRLKWDGFRRNEGMIPRILLAAFALAAVTAVAALLCAATEAPRTDVLAGKRLCYSAWGETGYACIYCHADFDERRSSDPYHRPAHPLVGVTARPGYFAGAYRGPGGMGLARAVNTCVVAWLGAEPLASGSDELAELLAYLDAISADADAAAKTPVAIEKGGAFTDAPVGNPRRGEKLFAAACTLCHREGGAAMPYDFANPRTSRSVWNRLRGYQLAEAEAADSATMPMKMPFFSADRLTDQDAADIVSYLEWQFALAVPRHPELPLEKPPREPAVVEPESPAAPEEAPPEVEPEPEPAPAPEAPSEGEAPPPPDEEPAPPPEDTGNGATDES